MAEQVDRGYRPPGSLSLYKNSVPGFMAVASKPCTLTAFSAGKPTAAGPANKGKQPLWLEVHNTAVDNGWDEIAAQLRVLEKGSVEEANAHAEKVRDQVSAKKARAA